MRNELRHYIVIVRNDVRIYTMMGNDRKIYWCGDYCRDDAYCQA